MEFLPIIILFVITSSCPQPGTCAKHNNFTDLDSLLTFRTHADPHGILDANWTVNTSFCNWVGVRCSRRRQRVTAIHLNDFSLQGSMISPYLGNLSFLSELDLSNNSFTGPIPESIGHLPRLVYISLGRNFLTGFIPPSIFNMSSLITFAVTDNNLSGSLPSNNSLAMPPHLIEISLVGNHFTGDVLPSFLQCPEIQLIRLTENQFSGTIPAEIGTLSELIHLNLGANQLTGTIPPSLGNLTKLTWLRLGWNKFSGIIPEEIGNLMNLRFLAFSGNGNMVGSIPTSLLNISMLCHFDLSHNKLTGSIPGGIGKSLPMLEWFHVGGNQLSGGLEFLSSLSNCKNLDHIQIQNNRLDGVLPGSVGNLSTILFYFDASGNLIKGNIPGAIGNLSNLIYLIIDNNELTGALPSNLARLDSLQSLSLAFNSISGLIPSGLGLMKNLNVLSLKYNKLSGPIPESLANISMIQKLYLSDNNFSTNIPQSLWTLASLLELDLSKNNLSGSLPPQVSNLKALILLDLSLNLLSGNITSHVGELSMLLYLDLSKNSFQGQIPESFGGLISAFSINLSCNFLSGSIPKSLANIPYLYSLNLSFNKLEGQVPKGRVFLNSSITSLIGNEAICGAPQLHTPPCLVRSDSKKKLLSLKYILIVTVSGVVLLVFVCLVYAFCSRRRLKSVPETNVLCLDYHRAIAHYELIRATENFNESNLVGRGGFGSVFRGCLDDGLFVAVKVFNLEIEGSLKSFDAECQVLKMVRHRNLIKIISVCSNLDFKALILEYMPCGSLEYWLYSNNCFLNLMQRLNIIVDVSLALEYLHHHHPQVVLHCDLKPTNILLDEELVAHVSDFGICKILLGDSTSMATASILGTIGYIPPEYATTGTVSKMGDVYSFGILLLETFTGRKPVDSAFGDQSSLREWICKAHPNTTLDVMDRNILMNNYTSDALQKLNRCMSSVIELGLLCSSYLPMERIPMTEVAGRLQKIKIEYLSA